MGIVGRALIAGKIRTAAFFESFSDDERGVSAIIATVLILVIVVALVAIFWDKISAWFSELWNKIVGNETVNNIT